MRYTNAATIISEDFRDTEDLDGLFSGWDPETRTYDPESWQYEDMEVAAASGQREHGRAHGPGRPRRPRRRARAGRAAAPRRDAAAPALRLPAAAQALRPLHPRARRGDVRRLARAVPRGVRGAVRQLRAASARAPSATPSAGRSTPSACSTSAPPRSSSCCWATSGARAAASWPCAATRRSRARPTSRRSTTSCPATCRCPRPRRTASLRRLHRAELAAGRLLGQHGRLHRLAAEGVVGRRGHGRERLLLRPPAAPDRRPLLLHDAGRDGRRDGQGPVRHGREPDRGRGQRRATTAPPCAASTGSWCATSSRSRRPPSGTTRRRSRPARSRTADIATEVFLLPGGHPRREEGHLHQHPAPAAVARAGRRADAATAARSCGSCTTSAAACARSWPARARARDRAVLELTWDYPTEGAYDDPDAEAVLREIGGVDLKTGKEVPDYLPLKDDGSTACGCWIYAGCYADGVNQVARRKPGSRAVVGGARVGLGVADEPAHPLQPRLGRSRGQAVVGAQALPLVGRRAGQVDGRGRPRLQGRHGARLRAARGRPGPRRAARRRAVHHAGRRQGVALRARRAGRRPDAHALRAARVAVRQPALRDASSPTRRASRSAAPRTPTTPPTASRASRSSPTWRRPTG